MATASDQAKFEAELKRLQEMYRNQKITDNTASPLAVPVNIGTGHVRVEEYENLLKQYAEKLKKHPPRTTRTASLKNPGQIGFGSHELGFPKQAKKAFVLQPATRTPLHDFAEQICGEAHAISRGDNALAASVNPSTFPLSAFEPSLYVSKAVLEAFETGCRNGAAESHSGPDGFWFVPGIHKSSKGRHRLVLNTYCVFTLEVDKELQDWQARLVFYDKNPDMIYGIVDNNFI